MSAATLCSTGAEYIWHAYANYIADTTDLSLSKEDEAACVARCNISRACGMAVHGVLNGKNWCFLQQMPTSFNPANLLARPAAFSTLDVPVKTASKPAAVTTLEAALKITIFNGKILYFKPFSIVMLIYHGVIFICVLAGSRSSGN